MKKAVVTILGVIFSLIFTASLAFPALAASTTIPKKASANGKDVMTFSYNSATKTLTAKEPKLQEEFMFMEDPLMVVLSTLTSGDVPTQNVILGTYANSGGEPDYIMALALALSEPVRSGKVTKFVLDTTANSEGTVSHYNFKKDENGNISEVDFDEGDNYKYVEQIGYSGSRIESVTVVAGFGRTDTYLYQYDKATNHITGMEHIDTTDTRSAGTERTTFTTDNIGRITKDGTWELTYNDKNQLTKAVWPGFYEENDDWEDRVTNYKYDAAGNLINLTCPKENMTMTFTYMTI